MLKILEKKLFQHLAAMYTLNLKRGNITQFVSISEQTDEVVLPHEKINVVGKD